MRRTLQSEHRFMNTCIYRRNIFFIRIHSMLRCFALSTPHLDLHDEVHVYMRSNWHRVTSNKVLLYFSTFALLLWNIHLYSIHKILIQWDFQWYVRKFNRFPFDQNVTSTGSFQTSINALIYILKMELCKKVDSYFRFISSYMYFLYLFCCCYNAKLCLSQLAKCHEIWECFGGYLKIKKKGESIKRYNFSYGKWITPFEMYVLSIQCHHSCSFRLGF